MAPGSGPENTNAADLAQRLAELADRLRLSFADQPGPPPPGPADRLHVHGLLLARLGAESRDRQLTALAAAVTAVADAVSGPESLLAPPERRSLSRLEAFLDEFFAALDRAGGTAADLPAVDWRAGAPAVVDELVLILVASPFRAAAVEQKLDGRGCATARAATPEDALALLVGPRRVRCVVCDNQEPTNHLQRLRDVLGSRRTGAAPVILLAVAAPREGADRARRLGADGIWREPFDPDDLWAEVGG